MVSYPLPVHLPGVGLTFSYGNLGISKPNLFWKHWKTVNSLVKVTLNSKHPQGRGKLETSCLSVKKHMGKIQHLDPICWLSTIPVLIYIDVARKFEEWVPWVISVEITVNCQCHSYSEDRQKLWLAWHHFALPQKWIFKWTKGVSTAMDNWLWYNSRINNA